MSITTELREWFDTYRIHWFGRRPEIEPMLDRIDAELAERYVALPMDADGVPIRVGDVMEWCDPDGEVTVTCEVDAVGVECFFAWDGANGRYAQKCANVYSHHHEPTVEDVLREFADEVRRCCDTADTIAEYAAKLRLKEDE